MPVPRILTIQPYFITEQELETNKFTEVQLALIKTKAFDAMVELAFYKAEAAEDLQAAYLRGKFEAYLELLNISKVDI